MEKRQKDIWSKIVAKAWSDPSFKQRLLKNPNQVLQEEGFQIPKGFKIIIHENTENVRNLVLPQKQAGEITEEVLSEISGGAPAVSDCLGS